MFSKKEWAFLGVILIGGVLLYAGYGKTLGYAAPMVSWVGLIGFVVSFVLRQSRSKN